MEFYKLLSGESRKAMSLPILKLLGHQLATSQLSDDSKRVIWSASVIAFFGPFRLGEILSKNEKSFNPMETLLWRDIRFYKDSVLIRVKIPKNRNPNGEFIDLFEFKHHNCCPVETLLNLKSSKTNKITDNSPVFMFESGTLLTPRAMSHTIRSLLEPKLGSAASMLSGHSFRAGIPSALSNHPELASDEEIKAWGRWDSSACNVYKRLNMNKKRAIFVKITSALMDNKSIK